MDFKIDYHTIWGENIAIKADGHEELIMLSTIDGMTWIGSADLPNGTQYRYCVVRDGQITRIEQACMPHVVNGNHNVSDSWTESQRIAGIAVPVFSLRSRSSQGVGDFGDLKMLVSWADRMGLKAIQILPINDTTHSGTWKDSYPYNSISTIALHPMYFDLRQFTYLNEDFEISPITTCLARNEYEEDFVDYEQVNIVKRKAIIRIFEKEGNVVLSTDEYREWFGKNEFWLKSYAQYRMSNVVYSFLADYNEELYYFTQYILHLQLKDVSDYAKSLGIMLKGDIPIGVSRDSAEVAAYPSFFNMDESTGAPPDAFCDDGQNWGFPTYNWEEMANDGYQWWKNRMHNMAQYFSAYRIDHILGFFRIWAIPVEHKSGLEGYFSPCLPYKEEPMPTAKPLFIHLNGGYVPRIGAKKEPAYQLLSEEERRWFDALYEDFFYHRHNQFWYEEAMKKLPILTFDNLMVCCGEDLGMIPECVAWVMKQLNILSLEMQTMPKQYGVEFGYPKDNPSMSVCTISSHDTPSMRGWWEEDHQRAQRYYNQVLQLKGEAPQQAPGWICERIICDHLASPSYLCILTLQDWLSINETLRHPDAQSERINIPANPRHYWRWRMHRYLDDFLTEESVSHESEYERFNLHIRQLVAAYGRKITKP